MRKMATVVLSLLVSLGVFGYGYSRGTKAIDDREQIIAQGPEVPQPSGWVAFTANVERSEPRAPDMKGRFWRSSEGSSRLELVLDGKLQSVMIKNISRALLYTFAPVQGWVSQPMVLPPQGYRPLRYRSSQNFAREAELMHGFVVYRATSPEGDVTLSAPDLNFFVLTRETARGVKEHYSSIRLQEPDPQLFEAPSGVAIRHSSEPGGIVWRPRQR